MFRNTVLHYIASTKQQITNQIYWHVWNASTDKDTSYARNATLLSYSLDASFHS